MHPLLLTALGVIIAGLIGLVIARVWPTPAARLLLVLERVGHGLRSHRRRVGDIDWHYLEGGRGPVLVMLHGFNADAYHFTRIHRHLRGHCRLIAPDLPGFGDTRHPDDLSFDIESQARHVLNWLDALGIQRCDLGGNSMGGYLAAAIARLAPERVNRLWLLAPGGLQNAPYAELFQAVAVGHHNPLVIRNQADFDRLTELCFVRRPWIPSVLQRHLARRAATGCDRALAIFAALRFDSPPLESFAGELHQPTLLMWGSEDRVLHPAGQAILAELLPDCRSLPLVDVGHLPQLERPRECARAWLDFSDRKHDGVN